MIGDTASAVPMRLAAAALVFACLAGTSSCSDTTGPGQKDDAGPKGLIISDPLAGAATEKTAGLASVVTSVAYVSLIPGTYPSGVAGKIANRRTAFAQAVALVSGGFDPVAIPAEAGDTLDFAIDTGGADQARFAQTVPASLKVGVVRTDPPTGKRDVALNLRIVVVFTEPVDPASVTSATLTLTQGGTSVSGQVSVSDDGLEATFQPSADLLPATDYTITVGGSIRDTEGSQLGASLSAPFTTGTASGAAVALGFEVQPVNTLLGLPMPRVVVHALDASGNLATGFSGSITLALGTNTSGGSLSGGTTLTRGSIAEFDHLRLDKVGSGMTLVATAAGLPAATSEAFDVEPVADGLAYNYRQDICLVNISGVGRACLGAGGWDPDWSPDGSKIAFSKIVLGNVNIYVMNGDGTGLTRLTTGTWDRSPAWSPDGKKIAFASDLLGSSAIFVVNADGSGLTQLTSPNEGQWSDPAWSPDGKTIAVTRTAGTQNIYVMNADGTGVRELTSMLSWEPAWSPDGAKIAFVGSASTGLDGVGIYVMRADGSGVTQLTHGVVDDNPTWSPDGTKIAFASTAIPNGQIPFAGLGFYTLTIYLMNADGSGRLELIPEPSYSSGTFLDAPAWRPRVGR